MLISSFFTKSGVPQTGLSPTIRIWEVTPGSQTLVVTDAAMLSMGDGFYKFNFTTYDPLKTYNIRSNGDPLGTFSLTDAEKFAYAGNESFRDDIVDGVWDETATDHITAGSMGLLQNQIAANAASLTVSMVTVLSIINRLLNYDENRTRIDPTAKTLTVYEDDEVTVMKVFNLKDDLGNPSVTQVCERDPV